MSGDSYGGKRRRPQKGQVWRSRDPRDDGLEVVVLDAWGGNDMWPGWVRIQRFRKTNVRFDRFHRDYEFVR